jgi:proteasome lid subunit RPN8/RPN11
MYKKKKKGKVPKQILAHASVQKPAEVMGILQAHKQNT